MKHHIPLIIIAIFLVTHNESKAQCYADAGPDAVVCKEYNKIQLNGLAYGPGTVTYSWSPSVGLSNPNISNPSVIIDSTITYILTTTFSSGCSDIDSITITVVPIVLPFTDAGPDQTICAGSSVTVGTPAIDGNSYYWLSTDGISYYSTSATPTITPSSSFKYALRVTTTYSGCYQDDTVNITVLPKPTITNAGPDLAVCKGDTISIGVPAQSGYNYRWMPTIALNDSLISRPLVNSTSLGGSVKYILIVTDSNGCSSSDAMLLNIKSIPVASAGSDKEVCINGAIQIGMNSVSGVTYSWSPSNSLNNSGISNPIASPSSTTDYIITATNSLGCKNRDTVTVLYNPNTYPVVDAGADVGICLGDSSILGQTFISGNSYSWTPTLGLNNASISNPKCSPSSTTIYVLSVTNSVGCTSLDTVIAVVNSLPSANAGSDKILCKGDSILFGSAGTPGCSYSWNPSNGLKNANSALTLGSPNASASYILTAVSAHGCIVKDTIRVIVNTTTNPVITRNVDTLTSTVAVQYQWMLNDNQISGANSGKFMPLSEGNYNLRATDINGCQTLSNTLNVANKTIGGLIRQNDGQILRQGKVLLLKLNTDSTVSVIDTTWTDYYTGYYQMHTIYSSTHIAVIPSTYYSPMEMPSYYSSGIVFQNALPIVVNSNLDSINFKTIKEVNATGSGDISGNLNYAPGVLRLGIIGGSHRLAQLTAGANLRIFLMNNQNQPVRTLITDGSGYFQFSNLPFGEYTIWIDRPYLDNSLSPKIDLTASNSSVNNIQLYVQRTYLSSNVTAIQNGASAISSCSIYPNPFNERTNIQYSLNESSQVKIEVYNVLGQKEKVLFDGEQGTGDYDVEYTSNSQGGIYFVNVTVNGVKNIYRLVEFQ